MMPHTLPAFKLLKEACEYALGFALYAAIPLFYKTKAIIQQTIPIIPAQKQPGKIEQIPNTNTAVEFGTGTWPNGLPIGGFTF